MTILWTTNVPICAMAEELGLATGGFGGWMEQAYNHLRGDSSVKLVIVTSWNNPNVHKKIDGNIVYYMIPGGDAYAKFDADKASNLKAIKEIIEAEHPDLMHLWGTESQLGLAFSRVGKGIPTVVYIQGVMKSIVEHYFESTPKSGLQRAVTFYDIVKGRGINRTMRKLFKKAKTEQEILRRSGNIICDNNWCEAVCKAINPQLHIYKQNLPIDDVFKEDVESNKKKRQIFCASQYAPFKGFQVLLSAIKIVKEKFPDVVVNIPGGWRKTPKTLSEKLRYDTYSNAMNKLISEWGLTDNICNLGGLSRKEMAKQMHESTVFVQCSTVENHSSTMREALYTGIPCIVSNVGCAAEYIQHGVNGFLYRNNEPEVLAHYIIYLLENEEEAKRIGTVGKASIEHKYQSNENWPTLSIYEDILKSESC